MDGRRPALGAGRGQDGVAHPSGTARASRAPRKRLPDRHPGAAPYRRATGNIRANPPGHEKARARRASSSTDRHERPPYSHSIVAGGFPLMSYTTRDTPRTSLMIRFDTRPRKSYGRCAQCAVMKSIVSTARNAITHS